MPPQYHEAKLPAAFLRSGRALPTEERHEADLSSQETDWSSDQDTATLGSFNAQAPQPSVVLPPSPLHSDVAESPTEKQPASPSYSAPSQTQIQTGNWNNDPSYSPQELQAILEILEPTSQACPQDGQRPRSRKRRRSKKRPKKLKDSQTSTTCLNGTVNDPPQSEASFLCRDHWLAPAPSASPRPIRTAEQAYPLGDALKEFLFPRNMDRPAPRIPPGLPFPAHLSNPVMDQSAHALEENRYRFRPGRECFHESVIRRWTYPFDVEVCDSCGERKRFLYACTCDTPDWAPYPPSIDLEDENVRARSTVILSKSIQRWIAMGAYTPKEIEKLLDQKVDCLTKAWNQRKEDSPEPSNSSPRPPDPTDSLSLRIWALWAWEHNQGFLPDKNSRVPCRRLGCESCWPAAERAWGSIDAVVNEPYVSPPRIAEYINRPVSNVKILRNLPSYSCL